MKAYLLTLTVAALSAALVSILSPDGEKKGISKHVKLLSALLLICVLAAPIKTAIEGLRDLLGGSDSLPDLSEPEEDSYQNQMNEALEQASTSYFTDMLTQMLETEFSIQTGDVRCRVEWERTEARLSPSRVTVILSGKAIWKNPEQIEVFVSELLGCECISAIE